MLQFIRRSIQIIVIIFIFLIPILGLFEIVEAYYRGHYIYMTKGDLWQRLFTATDGILQVFNQDDPMKVVRETKGTFFWSFTVFGFNISDPFAFIGFLFSSKTFYMSFFTSILLLSGITLIFGRVYCSWVCPMHLIFELNNKLRDLLARFHIRPLNIGFNRLHKYTILIVGGLISLILGVHVLYFLYPPIILNREVIHFIYFRSLGIGTTILVILIFLELSFSQRAWCRYFCPGGAVWSLLGARRVVRIKWDGSFCDDCGKCNLACEFGLNPMRGEMGMECDNCGRCISNCEPRALRWGLLFPWQRKVQIAKR